MNFRRQRKLSGEKTKITFIHIYSLRLPEQKIIETIKKFCGRTNISVAAAQDQVAFCCFCYCSWSVMYLMFRREHNSTSFYARNTKIAQFVGRLVTFFAKLQEVLFNFIAVTCRHRRSLKKVSLKQYLCCRDYNFSCSEQFLKTRRYSFHYQSDCTATTTAECNDVLLAMQSNKTSFVNLGIRLRAENKSNF